MGNTKRNMNLPNAQLPTIVNAVKAGLLWARAHLALVALISLAASVALWRLEHDARLRRDFELQQLRRDAAAEIANLRARAAAALDDADAGAQRVRDLEARRLQLERVEANLKSEISSLKSKERARLQEVAALPFPRLAERLRSQLGAASIGARGLPAQAGGPTPEFVLTEPGARAVAAALVERDACREQAQAKDALLANCQEQGASSRAALEEMARSVSSLKEAVRLKDEIQSRSEAVHRAELDAARGSRLRRFGRALQYVGAGVVIGVVVAR